MKLAQILIDKQPALCAVLPEGLLPLASAGYASMQDAIKNPAGLENAVSACAESALIPEADAVFLPAVTSPGKLLCVGVNYRKHIEECGETLPVIPVLFSKFNSALAAHGEVIHPPKASSQLDYEAELVVVIGKGGKNIPESEALHHIFGYACGNDLSARDLQLRTSQWLAGKTCDQFAPVGPYVVTADEIDPHALPIESRLNGAVRQQSNTSNMIFSCEKIISYISSIMTLEAGDVIFTGTPDGVILGLDEDKRDWMQPGDVIEVEIGGVGVLKNTIGESV